MTRSEEILQNYEHDVHYYGYNGRKDILKAMDEYAKEMAVGFKKWAGRCGYREADSFGIMWYPTNEFYNPISATDLYTIYLEYLKSKK